MPVVASEKLPLSFWMLWNLCTVFELEWGTLPKPTVASFDFCTMHSGASSRKLLAASDVSRKWRRLEADVAAEASQSTHGLQ